MRPPLVVSRDRSLVDALGRLAAAAGVTPEERPAGVALLHSWSLAPLVVIGTDVAAEVQALSPPRRAQVLLLSTAAGDTDTYRAALELGAERLVVLPDDAAWLTERLLDAADDGLGPGAVVGVVGGSGGAGATTFACALGQVAARSGSAVVMDTDHLGPGIDRVLGLEAAGGVRWTDLETTTGRLGGRSLREALPRRDTLGVLTWPPGRSSPLSDDVVRECLFAARRGHDVVVVDLPRVLGPLVADVVSRCDLLAVVATPSVCGIAAATRLVRGLDAPERSGLVLRGRGLDPVEIAEVTGLRVLGEMGAQRRLTESVDLGLGPVRSRRGPLARAAGQVLAQMASPAMT